MKMKTRVDGAKLLLSAAIAATFTIGMLAVGQTAKAAGPPAPSLGTADSFAVLAGAGITNTGPTTINGDVGSFPTTTQTGFASVVLTGTNHMGDAVTQGAKTDLVTAYNTAAGSGPTIPVVADLGGQTLAPGVYNSASSLGLTGTLTLSGTSSDVWIFQAGSTLTTATGSSVVLIGGAQSCNVFWQVGSSATLNGSTSFKGNILALTSITLVTGATIDGRALAQNGAVTLDTNVITRSTCSTPIATPTPAAPTATPTPAAGPASSQLPNVAVSGSEPRAAMGTVLVALILIGSLGALAMANVRTARRHK